MDQSTAPTVQKDETPQRPNIILVCVDEMRADAFGAAGNEHIDTPNLDELARRGYRFTRAYSATPTCVPARVAMFTGKSPHLHGRYGYRDGIDFPSLYPVTLQSTLREAGYQAFGVGKMHVFPERARCGFDDVLLHDGFMHISRTLARGTRGAIDDYVDFLRRETGDPRADYQETGLGCNAITARPWEREERLHPTRWVADESMRFIERRDPSRPFFLYMSFHRPHAPFDPPRWLWDKYVDRARSGELPERAYGDWVGHFDQQRDDHGIGAQFGAQKDSTHQQVKAGYYGSIEFIDHQLNRLNETLSDHGLLQDTVILFVSDHGDMMGDHDMYQKAVGYEGSARIPFVLHLPPRLREQWGPGGEFDAIVELRDVMPTLLDLAGVEVPEGVDGISVREAISERTPLRDHLQGEHTIVALGNHSMQWIRSERFKYIWFSGDGHEQLFDLEADPRELHDLATDPDHAGELERHRALLVEHLRDREEGFVDGESLVPGRRIQSEASWVREHALA